MTITAEIESIVHQCSFIMSYKVGKGGQIWNMVKDIVPDLIEQIDSKKRALMITDRSLSKASVRIQSGKGSLQDVHTYAARLGEDLSKALTSTLTVDNLPNGKLYYNIAERTVLPALEENYNLINQAAVTAQKAVDKKAKIGLESVKADFPKQRVQGLIDKMTADDVTADDVISWLTEPIVNNSEAFVDDFVEANCKFRTQSGLKTKIVRKAEPNCCKWCSDLEGSYDYGDAPDDIYRRHEFCRCTVTFETDKERQDVWSKRSWKASDEELAKRRDYGAGQKEPKSPAEIINQKNMLYKEAVSSELRKENKNLRQQAANATGEEKEKLLGKIRSTKKLTPEERIELFEKYQQRRKTSRR